MFGDPGVVTGVLFFDEFVDLGGKFVAAIGLGNLFGAVQMCHAAGMFGELCNARLVFVQPLELLVQCLATVAPALLVRLLELLVFCFELFALGLVLLGQAAAGRDPSSQADAFG